MQLRHIFLLAYVLMSTPLFPELSEEAFVDFHNTLFKTLLERPVRCASDLLPLFPSSEWHIKRYEEWIVSYTQAELKRIIDEKDQDLDPRVTVVKLTRLSSIFHEIINVFDVCSKLYQEETLRQASDTAHKNLEAKLLDIFHQDDVYTIVSQCIDRSLCDLNAVDMAQGEIKNTGTLACVLGYENAGYLEFGDIMARQVEQVQTQVKASLKADLFSGVFPEKKAPLEITIGRLLFLYQHFLGLSFTFVEPLPTWHKDIRLLEVRKLETGALCGHVYCDFYERSHKPEHAFYQTIIPARWQFDEGKGVLSLIPSFGVMSFQMIKPTEENMWNQATIDWPQAEALLSQFDAALHALLGSTVAAAAAGTSIKLILLKSRHRCLGKK